MTNDDLEILRNKTFFILENRELVPANALTMAKWMEESTQSARDGTWSHPRFIGKTTYGEKIGISTVFLCINHNFLNQGPPVVFETMIFGVENDECLEDYQERCCTYDEAVEMHKKACALVEAKYPGMVRKDVKHVQCR